MKNKNDVLDYISRFRTDLYTEKEKLALDHYVAQAKLLSHVEYSEKWAVVYKRNLSSDPEVIELLKDGIDELRRRATERVFNERFDEINLNTCLKCGRVARTPKSKQCRFCYHDWH